MYTDQEKAIFQLPNTQLRFDPLELRRKLVLHTGGQLHSLILNFNDDSELVSAQAEDALVRAGRLAFNLKPLTEKGGVSDATVMEYLAHYLEWLSAPSQPAIKLSLTSQHCTDCPPPFPT